MAVKSFELTRLEAPPSRPDSKKYHIRFSFSDNGDTTERTYTGRLDGARNYLSKLVKEQPDSEILKKKFDIAARKLETV